MPSKLKHKIHTGELGGKFQVSHGKPRYLLDKPVKTGPNGGKYQPYGRGKHRQLLS